MACLAAGLLFVGCSCGPTGGYHGHHGGLRVAVVGDSITVQAEPDTEQVLAQHYRVLVNAMFGLRIDQQLGTIKGLLHNSVGPPDRLVINLGTNDALQNNPAALQNLALAMTLVAHVKCVVWVTINLHADVRGDSVVAQQINDTIGSAAATHANFRVLDWNALIHQGNNAATWIDPHDGIHLTGAGAYALSLEYLRAVRSCPSK